MASEISKAQAFADVLIWINRGNDHVESGMYPEAIQCYDKALEINPRDAKTWFNKGNVLYELARYQEAIISFQKFIEFAPHTNASQVRKVEELIRLLKEMV